MHRKEVNVSVQRSWIPAWRFPRVSDVIDGGAGVLACLGPEELL